MTKNFYFPSIYKNLKNSNKKRSLRGLLGPHGQKHLRPVDYKKI